MPWVNNCFTSFCLGQGLVVSYLSTIQNQLFNRIYDIVLLWSWVGGQLLTSSSFGQTLLVSYRQPNKITKLQAPEQTSTNTETIENQEHQTTEAQTHERHLLHQTPLRPETFHGRHLLYHRRFTPGTFTRSQELSPGQIASKANALSPRQIFWADHIERF